MSASSDAMNQNTRLTFRRYKDGDDRVRAWQDKKKPKSVFAEFTMLRARQMDVVDRIMHEFALYMEDYDTQSVWFPQPPRKRRPRRTSPTKRRNRAVPTWLSPNADVGKNQRT